MLDINELLAEIKQSPYTEIDILSPCSGVVTFADIKEKDKAAQPSGAWKEIPGTLLATIERERNPKKIFSPQKGSIKKIHEEHNGEFVEAGTPLLTLQHFLTKREVIELILQKALYLFKAPQRAKYYFIPDVEKKVQAGGHRGVKVTNNMDLFIMSRMKREVSLPYTGPEGLIYAIYFSHNENIDEARPLIGVCPEEQVHIVEDVITKVKAEWEELE